MGVSFEEARANLPAAVEQIFGADNTVRAVGIARHETGFAYRAVRHASPITTLGGAINAFADNQNVSAIPAAVAQIPVAVIDSPSEVRSLVVIHDTTPTTSATATSIPEVNPHRPLVAGLQIENFSADTRERTSGKLKPGFLIVGTLGCFVKTSDGTVAILSNNHVVAEENHGRLGKDVIYQSGSVTKTPAMDVARLTAFKKILPSPSGTVPPSSKVKLNDFDAGIAKLGQGVTFQAGYLPSRSLPVPSGIAAPNLGDSVFKVGRTTGLTRGTITSVATTVGPIPYTDGPSWFQMSFEIEGVNGTQFSDHGDSGSAIVLGSGEIVGLLYAGNGTQTYACPIEPIFTYFGVTLA